MKIKLSGDELIEIFRNAMVVQSTAEFAKSEAKRSEKETLNNLDYLSQGSYLNPNNLPSFSQEQVAKSSVDAHVKKVQASQISKQSTVEVANLEQRVKEFIGKKAYITVLQRQEHPVEAIWYDETSNEYYPSQMNPAKISGKIEQILLDKNAIMIRPTFMYRITSKNRPFFAIYIINPNNLDAFVKIDL